MSFSSPFTVPDLARLKAAGQPIVALTAYDASFARLMADASIDVVLVGDSLGMVVQGHPTTLPVRLDDMIYHAACVARGNQTSLRIVDLPFLSFRHPEQALISAARLVQEGKAQMVKLEGGNARLETVAALVREGIPVCGHLGLLPQAILKLGSFSMQGREAESAARLLEEALRLEEAGIDLLVLECIPSSLAAEITRRLKVPTIGIGAGRDCDGQVLVMQDLLGCSPRCPSFCRNFLEDAGSVLGAFQAYAAAVRSGTFPEVAQGLSSSNAASCGV